MKTLVFANAIFVLLLTNVAPREAGAASQPDSRAPQVTYEIFTRSFQDSGKDGIGDLDGITSRLDYLNDSTDNSLGVDAIWLTPIFPSPSYHGYDATDYESIQSEYGDLPAIRRLITAAHGHGIKILLDMAVNHTSIRHPWFVSSSAGENSPDRALYLWSPTPLDWFAALLKPGQSPSTLWHKFGDQFYFSTFGGGKDPDLNWRNPEVLSRISSAFRFWVEQGVDGFRLDAAKFLVKGPHGEQNAPETHAIWRQIVAKTRQLAPNTYFVGEVWDSARAIASYSDGNLELDSCFDFPIAAAVRSSLAFHDPRALAAALLEHIRLEPAFFTSPIIGNHDMNRISQVAGGDTRMVRLAALVQLTLPGTPTIYYGDELGMAEGVGPAMSGDLGKRTPMPWTTGAGAGFTLGTPWVPFSSTPTGMTAEEQSADPRSVLLSYRSLIHLRKQTPVLTRGDLMGVKQPVPGVLTYFRTSGDSAALVVVNFSQHASQPFLLPSPLEFGATAELIHGPGTAAPVITPANQISVEAMGPESGEIVLLH